MLSVPRNKPVLGGSSSNSSTKPEKRKKLGVANNLATHVPDFVLATSNIGSLPYSQKFEGILLFADISGFTALCERYSLDCRSGSGTDKLTRTLNNYLSDIIDNIMGSEGDILKFAGDAFMCLWKIKSSSVDYTINRVIQCGLRIQQRCDNRITDVGVKLRVKLGVAIGAVRVTTIGNEESRHYVLSGPAVDDANTAEKFSLPGTFVLGPKAWAYTCDHETFEYESLSDGNHVSILSYITQLESDADSKQMTVNEKIAMQMSGNISTGLAPSRYTQADVDKALANFRRASGVPETKERCAEKSPMGAIVHKDNEEDAAGRARQSLFRSITDDEKGRLRKYIIKPVLQKIDDDLPLEYLSEMRQVSVLFINLVFASLSSKRGDGERRSIQAAFTVIYDTASEFEGCLNKVFMFDKGCTYIVIFGLPGYKHEDDCSRALRSAYSMSNKLETSPNISKVSIGVTSGSSFCGVVGHVHRHEYTVIGKKVNMAARLMMHYPGKVSCDPETFHHSKLQRNYFHELPHKEMKGVRKPGTIHEYIEKDDYVPSAPVAAKEVPMFEYPLLGRDDEMILLLDELEAIEEKRQDGGHVPFIFIYGESGIGKTRFLDAAIEEALKDNHKVISCALSVNDSNSPYFIVKSMVSMLLGMENCNSHIEREHQILHHIHDEQLREELCLLNDLLVVKFPANPKFVFMNSEEQTTVLHTFIRKIVHMFTRNQCVIFVVDDAHFIDNDSWEFLDDFAEDDSAVCILASRPLSASKKAACEPAARVWNHPDALHLRLHGLESQYLAPLACQLLEVVQVPEVLVKILEEKSHGVASWCEQIIREMYSEDQLQVVPMNSHMIPTNTESISVTPNASVVRKRRDSIASNDSSYNRSRRASVNTELKPDEWPVPATQLLLKIQKISEEPQTDEETDNVCIVSPGVDLTTVTIPDSMKGIILTRIDHMQPSEQMIVKCASVLGMTFTRKMLEVISPRSSTGKLRRLLHSLMQSDVFECAASHFNHIGVMQLDSMTNHTSSRHHIHRSTNVICLCPESEDQDTLLVDADISSQPALTQPVSNCRYLRFTSSIMQETAYDLFLGDQRRRLHRTAALFLESQAHKCDACGGGEFLPGHAINNEFVSMCEIRPVSSDNIGLRKGRRMSVDGDDTTESKNNGTESRFSIREKTSKLFGSIQKSVSRSHASKVHPKDVTENGIDAEKEREGTSTDRVEIQSIIDLPPVLQEVFGRRGRRQTITIHQSSEIPDNVKNISRSLISLHDDLDNMQTTYDDGDEDDLVLEAQLDLRDCCCLEILNSVFPQLVRHWKAAANTTRTIIFLSEAGGAAIATGNNKTALSYLYEAQHMIELLDAGEKPLPDDPDNNIAITSEEDARIKSMIGQALFHMGLMEESLPYFHSALKILHNRQPTTKLGLMIRLISETTKQIMHSAFSSFCIGSASSTACNRFVEQARCLSYIWTAYHGKNIKWNSIAAALQALNRAESADVDPKELVTAYTNMMQSCQRNRWLKLGGYYERRAMKRCMDSTSAVGPDDLIAIGYLYYCSMAVRLANGRILGAIDPGFSTLKVAKKLHDVTMELTVLPLLAQTLLLANRLVNCVEMINQLNYAAKEEDDLGAECLYYCCSMDLALSSGFILVSPERCEDFCHDIASEPNFSVDESKFCLMACLALWYSRKGLWEKSEEWIRKAEKARHKSYLTYHTVNGNFMIVECRLIQFSYALQVRISSELAGLEAKKRLLSAKMYTRRFPVFLPRYMHLIAYLHILQDNSSAAKKKLKCSIAKSLRLGSIADLDWAKHSQSVWFNDYTTRKAELWTPSYHGDSSQEPNITQAKLIKYSLPLPNWQ